MTPRLTLVAVGLLLAGTTALYASWLTYVPAYLMHDEVNFSLQAQAIATTGRDTNGRFLPVYFSEVGFEAGRDPVMIYVTAIMLMMRPLSDAAVRLPTALVGVLSVGLMFAVARRLFRSDVMAIVAAALLALTPAHFVNARLALSITYPIPFILLWMWCLLRYLAYGNRRWLFAAGLALGAGVYAYLAGLIMMPLYLAVTVLVVRRDRRELAWAAALGFAVALIPLAWWQFEHPDRYRNLLEAYQVQSAPLAVSPRARISAFWMFFSPDYLFLSGDGRLTNSTRSAGLFPLAGAVFIPIGVHRLWRGGGGAVGWGILAGLLAAPLATAASGRLEINRVLYAIPFGVLVAAYGVAALMAARRQSTRLFGTVLLASVPLQFGFVYADYLGAYRTASASWFGGDARGAVEDVLARATSGPIYLDRGTPIERYWRFYALVHQASDMVQRPIYYQQEHFAPSSVAEGALLICQRGDAVCSRVSNAAGWRRISSRIEPDGSTGFEVFEKSQPGQ